MDRDKALNRIGMGSSIIMLGLIGGAGLEYLVKAVLARFLGPETYGIYIQAYGVATTASLFAVFGFQKGIPRIISYYKGLERDNVVEEVLGASIKIVIPLSVLLSAVVYFSAEFIASSILGQQAISGPLKLFSITVVPLSVYYVLISLFRGLQNARYKIYLDDLLLPGIQSIMFFLVLSAGFKLEAVIQVYLLSLLIVLISGVYLLRQRFSSGLLSSDRGMYRKLVSFSWPLFVISILSTFDQWAGVWMLGWLVDAAQAGIFEVSYSIAGIISLLLGALNYMFMPVISELYGQNKLSDILEIYSISTRWIFSLTLPIFAGIIIFPEEIISLLYGQSYVTGATALRILAIGTFYTVSLGPAGMILLSSGRNKIFMAASAVQTGLNIGINFLLIPKFGILGAAYAAAISVIAGNTIYLLFAREELGGLPFNRRFIQPIMTILISSGFIYLVKLLLAPGVITSVILGAILVSIYLGLTYYIGGIHEEDIQLIKNLQSSLLEDSILSR